ncbi:MAG: hypothetical protein ACKVQS_01595 [Fimbriimonadaceae bacterium]
MSFSIRLANDEATVEPGSSAPVAFEIVNSGDKEAEFEVSLEGLDPEWAAIPVPTLWVNPGEMKVERIFIKPPRESESKAGVYPFVIRVRSMDSGESKTAQSSLAVNSFSNVSIEATPKRASVNVSNRSTVFDVTIMNLGNTDESLQIYASDVDDLIAFDFGTSQVNLSPGQQSIVQMTATAAKVKAFQSMAIAPVTVSTRSTDNPAVAASSQVHVEVRPLISTGPLIAILAVLVVLVGWILSIPKAPVINSYAVQPREALIGGSFELSWNTSNANSVTIVYGTTTLDKLPPDGQTSLPANELGDQEIQIYAIAGKVRSDAVTVPVQVTEPPTVPQAEILAFSAKQSEVPIGSSVVLEYRLNDAATYAYLEPIGQIEPQANSIQVPSPPDDLPGKGVKTITYTLMVKNVTGQQAAVKKVTVRFVKESKAVISKFEADPVEVDPLIGRTTLRWQVSNAVRIELQYGDRKDELTSMDDRRDFVLNEDTTFTITAYDAQGLETKKTISVKMKKPVEPIEPTVDPGGTTGTTGTTTNGGTTGTNPPTGGTTRPAGAGGRV